MVTWLHCAIPAAFSGALQCCESPVPPHNFLDLDPVTEKTKEHLPYCHVHQTSLRQLLLCHMVRYYSWSNHYTMGKLWPWRDAHGRQPYSNRLLHSKDDLLILSASTSLSYYTGSLQGRLGPRILAIDSKLQSFHVVMGALQCLISCRYRSGATII